MEYYKYKAKDESGKTISGTLTANDEIDLQNKLKADNKYLISAKMEQDNFVAKKIKTNAVADFSRNVGELLSAGVTLVRALKIISEDEAIAKRDRDVYANVLKQVKTGISLSDAMQLQGEAFPTLLINMYRSSENAGNLDSVAIQMAEYYDKEYRLIQKVKSSMTYPKILSALIVAVVAVLLGFVIPQFESLFEMMEELPVSTRVLLAISDFVKTKWYILIFIGIIIFAITKILMSIPTVRYYTDKLKIKMPKIGYLNKVIYTARFARTLSSLYSAGIPIMQCLSIAQTTIGNAYIEKQFDTVISDIKNGENLSVAIEKVDGFTKKLSSSIAVGEETGAMEKLLISMANQMDYDSEMALNRMVSYLEPVMIVTMAVIVGFIIIAVIQPIYGSYEAISTSY